MPLDDRGRNEQGSIVDWGKWNARANEDRAHADNVARAQGITPPSYQQGSAATSAPSLAGVPTQSPSGERGWNNIAPPLKDQATGQVFAVNPSTGRYEAVTSPADYGRFGIAAGEQNITVVPGAASVAGTTPGGVPGGQPGAPGGAPGAPSGVPPGGLTPEQQFLGDLAAAGGDKDANTLIVQTAAQKSLQAYYEGLITTGNDRLAFDRAKQVYEEEKNRLQLEFDRAKEARRVEELTRQFTAEEQERLRRFGLSEADITGTYQGQPTEERLQREQTGALQALNIQSTLRGPSDYAQYVRSLGNTPAGIVDLVNSLAGRYQLPTGAGPTGATVAPASLQSLINDLQPQNVAARQAELAGASRGLPAPNQINLAAWNRLLPSQQQIALGLYEGGYSGGTAYRPEDVARLIQQAAPQFPAGGTYGSFSFR